VFTRECLKIRTIPFCEAILNSTNYSYSCRGEILGGESSRKSFHKGGSTILMMITRINVVSGSLVEQFIL